jgi:hypothetical protein
MSTFFLTEIDPRAAVKGSRDPLGLLPIWSRFGRDVVGNLTTVTSSVRGFTTLLLGLYFAERVIESGKASEDDRVDLFLKFEQLAAYSRHTYNREGDSSRLLGVTRVARRLSESQGEVVVSASVQDQILSNQKAYGLWGLYTVAARESGFVERDGHVLTLRGRDFVERTYLTKLSQGCGKDGAEIARILEQDRTTYEVRGKHARIAKTLASVLAPKLTKGEAELYDEALVRGQTPGFDHTLGRQAALFDLLCEINEGRRFGWDKPFAYVELLEARKRAASAGYEALAAALERIARLEPFFVALSEVFGYLISVRDGSIAPVAKDIARAWGRHLRHIEAGEIERFGSRFQDVASREAAERLITAARALRDGDYAHVVKLLLEHNASVMNARGGAPWVTEERGRIQVRLREEGRGLSKKEDLPTLWYNSYFLNSLKTVGAQVREALH